MNKNSTTRAYDSDQRDVLPITAGGTGVILPENVVNALGGVSVTKYAQPNGVALLDRSAKIPLDQLEFTPGIEMPSIDGPTNIYTFTTTNFTITNFDSQTNYVIHANHGTVTRSQEIISYYAPLFPCVDVLQVNNNVVGINVIASYQEKPVISFPANNAVKVFLHPTITLGQINWTGYQDTIGAIEWEITKQGDTPVVEILTDHQLHYMPSYALLLNTQYTARVRVSGILTGTGEWSDSVNFTTTDVAIPVSEVAQLHPFPSTAHTTNYGITALAISQDGNVIVTGDTYFYFSLPEPAKHPGRVFIYSYENGNWVQNAIDSNIVDDGQYYLGEYRFAEQVALSLDKQKVLVLSLHDLNTPITNSATDPMGDIRIYETVVPNDYSTMNLIATYPAVSYGNTNTYENICYTISTTPNFERIVFSLHAGDYANNSLLSVVCILNFDGSNITSDANISKLNDTSTPYSNVSFGENVSLSENGLTLVVGSESQQINNTNSGGVVYVYERINDIWTETIILEPDDSIEERYFGWPVQISPDGTKIATFSNTKLDNTGNVYLFEKIGNTWTKTKKYVMPEMHDNQLGGEATSMCFNSDGTLLLMGSPWQSTPASSLIDGPWDYTGMVYLFDVSGPEILLVQTYTSPDVLNSDSGEYGEVVMISRDGSTIVITSPYSGYAIDNTKAGAIFVYK